MADLRMTSRERDAFLGDHCVAVLSVPADGKPPLMMPVLYRYEPDACIHFTYDRSTEKSRRIRVGTPVALTIEEHVPWASAYVTVEGVVETLVEDLERAELRRLAERYYGPEGVDLYMRAAPKEWVMLAAAVRPTRFLTREYEKLGIAKRD